MTHLKSLRLMNFNSLKKIKVCHEKLQILELNSCCGLVEANIDTPQLVSFMYQGSMIEFAKMVTSSTCTTTLSINRWLAYDNATFFRWRELLSFFGHCKALKLICNTQEEMMIPEFHRERLVSPLYDLQHLEMQIKSLEKIDRDLVDSLLWLSPLLKTLHISSGSCSRLKMLIKFLHRNLIDGEEDTNPFCCVSKPIKCWKHNFKRLEIQSGDVSTKNGSNDLQKYFLSNKTSDLKLLFQV
ncbi:hypothetical protein R6Q57_012866 [Mikania cordata]